jgi:hypothetical protein
VKLRDRIQQFYIENSSYIWAHHPICPDFRDHTLNIGKYRLCIGCFIGYPAAILGIVLTVFIFPKIMDNITLIIISVLCESAVSWSLFTWTKHKWIKIGQKFVFGFGAGIFLAYGFLYLVWDLWIRIIIVMVVFFNLNAIMFALHYRSHWKICAQCQLPKQGKFCPGYPASSP